MLLGLTYQLMRFITDLVLVRTRADAQLSAEVLALRHQHDFADSRGACVRQARPGEYVDHPGAESTEHM